MACIRTAIALLALSIFVSRCNAASVVTWMTTNDPPFYIYDGELAGHGIGDEVLEILQQALPEYDHITMRADAPRIMNEIKNKDNVCVFGALKNEERAQFGLYSDKYLITPTYTVKIPANNVALFSKFINKNGDIDFAALAADDKLRGGYVLGLPYTPPMGSAIEMNSSKSKSVYVRNPAQLHKMLMAGRIDYYIGEPMASNYEFFITNDKTKYISLNIMGSNFYTESYVFCSKGPIGSAVISSVNRFLADDQNWIKFVHPIARWVSEKDYMAALAGNERAR